MTSSALLPEDRSALRAIGVLIRRTEALRRAMERETASGFSPFAYLETRELGLSRILADLLDPAGPHGQGAVFLEDFLSRIGLGQPTSGAVVRREAALGGRRVDILVQGEDWVCAIENKPSAIDQPAQLIDYYDSITRIAGQNARLVYLSGDSSLPSEESIPRVKREQLQRDGKLFLFGFSGANPDAGVADFDDILASWCGLARPLRLQLFLGDCRSFLAQSFGGEKNSMEQAHDKSLAREILDDPEFAKTVLKFVSSADSIRLEVFRDFFSVIERKVKQHSPGAEVVTRIRPEDLGKRTVYLSFRPAEPRSPAWDEGRLAVIIEVPRGGIAFFGIGQTSKIEGEGSSPLDSPAFDEIRRNPDLPGAKSTREYGWPVWWHLCVTQSDRLQDFTAIEALHEATLSGTAEEIAKRIVTVLKVSDAALARNAAEVRDSLLRP